MSHFHYRLNVNAVKFRSRLPSCITKAVMLLGFMAFTLSSYATPAVAWSPPAISRSFFPGQTYQRTLTFTSSRSFAEVSVFVVPALRRFVTVEPSFFPTIRRNIPYTILLTISIPIRSPLGVFHSGTIQLRTDSDSKTIAKKFEPTDSETTRKFFAIAFEVQPGGFEQVNPDNVVKDVDGAMFPSDQLLARFINNTTAEQAASIGESLEVTLVGGLPLINLYQYHLPTTSIAALKTLQTAISSHSEVIAAYPNYLGNFSSTNDLEHLASCFPNAAATIAYSRIGLQQAYDAIATASPQLHSPVVGIIDTGIDFAHPEFQGVNLRRDPIYSLQDKLGHGTAVAGIIGANNLGEQLVSCDPTDAIESALQMNGLLAGVPRLGSAYILYPVGGPTTLSGSVFVPSGNAYELTALLAKQQVPIVNLSFSFPKCGLTTFLSGACISSDQFNAFTDSYRSLLNVASGTTLFVIAAGNNGMDAANSVPANAATINSIGVAAVGVLGNGADRRLNSSNFGVTVVQLSAPGEEIYIPLLSGTFSPTLTNLFGVNVKSYGFFGDTSGATALVTGAAAILKSLQPGLSPSDLKSILVNSGDAIATDRPIGGRRLNVLCAVQKVLPSPRIMDDDFATDSFDCGRWDLTVVPAGVGTVKDANQQLEMTRITPAASSYQGLATRCTLSGDFDVQVDYRLLNWPAQNFYTVRLAAQNLPQGDIGLVGVYRNSYADENYQFRSQLGVVGLVSVPTSDTSGTLGLRRSGSTISGYDSHGTIGSASTTQNPTGFVIDFATPSPTSPLNVAIAFDNFKVNSGTVVCPQ
jgi:hypothetical protein